MSPEKPFQGDTIQQLLAIVEGATQRRRLITQLEQQKTDFANAASTLANDEFRRIMIELEALVVKLTREKQ